MVKLPSLGIEEKELFPEGMKGIVDEEGNLMTDLREERRVRVVLEDESGNVALLRKEDVGGRIIYELPGGKVKREKPPKKAKKPDEGGETSPPPPVERAKGKKHPPRPWRDWKSEAIREVLEETGIRLTEDQLELIATVQETRKRARAVVNVQIFKAKVTLETPRETAAPSCDELERGMEVIWLPIKTARRRLKEFQTWEYKERFGQTRDGFGLKAFQQSKK